MRIGPLLLLLVPLGAVRAQRTAEAGSAARLAGVVLDSATGHPLRGVGVAVDGVAAKASTDSAGRFALGGVPAGMHTVRYRALGFAPQNVVLQFDAGRETTWTQALAPAPTDLNPVTVTQTRPELDPGLAGFEARRKIGRGQFMTADEWDRFAPVDLGSVLRRFHSLEVKVSAGGTVVFSTRGGVVRQTASGGLQDAKCGMRIGVDGQLMPPNFTLDHIPVAQVRAIEVYAGPAEIPAEFNSSSGGNAPVASRAGADPSSGSVPYFAQNQVQEDTFCGLVMIWSK